MGITQKATLGLVSLLVLGTSACLPPGEGLIDTDSQADIAKAALMRSLERTVMGVADRVEQTIVNGSTVAKLQQMIEDFEMGEFHPTQDEFKEAIDYLLGNPVLIQEGVVQYRPDSRFCSQVVAKNDPASCIASLSHIRIIQTVSTLNSGHVQIKFNSYEPISFDYESGVASLSLKSADILSTAKEIDLIVSEMNGNSPGEFPTQVSGVLNLVVTQESMGGVSISASLPDGFTLQGSDEGHDFQVTVDASPELAMVMMSSSGSIDVTVNLAGGMAQFSVKNNNNEWIPLNLNVPKLSGNILFSDPEQLLKMTALSFEDKAGVPNSHVLSLKSAGTTLLALDSSALSLKFYVINPTIKVEVQQGFDFDFFWTDTLGVFSDAGRLSMGGTSGLDIDLTPASSNAYGHVLSGNLQIVGEGVLEGSMNATSNHCFELGNQEGTNDSFPFDIMPCPQFE